MEWLTACGKGVAALFLHPLLYLAACLALWAGYRRVKSERRDFTRRVYRKSMELRYMLPQGLLWGLLLSAASLGSGFVLSKTALYVIGAVMVLVALTTSLRLLSPAVTLGISFIILFAAYQFSFELPIPSYWKDVRFSDEPLYLAAALLMGLLLVAEGFLLTKNAVKKPTPGLILSKRGQTVGIYKTKRVWLIPLFVLIPGAHLPQLADWYPVFSINGEPVMLVLVPFLLGFSRKVQGMLPDTAIKAEGRKVIVLGFVSTAAAAAGYWQPYLSIAAAVIGLFGRLWISSAAIRNDRNLPLYFSQSKLGVRILGVLPDTPADKMGLKLGEIITKMNGIHVNDERSFYKALQKNRAHCKLEIVGNNGEIRFVQRALFEGEHHELGVLFTENPNDEQHFAG